MRTLLPLIAVVVLVSSAAMADVPVTYVHDSFVSQTYCDLDSTTAFWDTAGGCLHLNPYEITDVGGYGGTGTAYHLAVAGDVAYVADGTAGLRLIDVTDPVSPSLIYTLDTAGSAYGVFLRGDYAYVADNDHGLQVIDVTDPTWPLVAGGVLTTGNSYDVEVVGNYAYVADRSGGLQVVDVGNPYVPTVVATRSTPGNAYGVEIFGHYCYVAASGGGLCIFDIADPANPVHIDTMTLSGYAWDLVAAAGKAYVVCDSGGLWILDLANPAKPTALSTFATAGPALDVFLDGRFAYVCESSSGLEIIDVSDPAAPFLKNSFNTAGSAWAAQTAGEYCFVADGSAGLRTLKIRDAIDMTVVGSFTGPNQRGGIEVLGPTAFAASTSCMLQAFDVGDPRYPQLLDYYGGYAYDMTVQGNRAYTGGPSGYGLRIFDVSSPENITYLGEYDPGPGHYGVCVEGDLAAVAHGASGFSLIDVGDASAPSLITLVTAEEAHDVLLHGDILFVGGHFMSAFDVSDPSSPVLLKQNSGGDWIADMALHGDMLYATVHIDGSGQQLVNAYDVSDPNDTYNYLDIESNPVLSDTDSLQKLAISGDRLYALGANALYFLDITDPERLKVLGSNSHFFGYVVDIAADDLFIGNADGLYVINMYESHLDLDANRAHSIPLNDTGYRVVGAKFLRSYSGPATDIFLTADRYHYEVFTHNSFHYFEWPGKYLMWRTVLETGGYEIDGEPALWNLNVFWEYDCPFIDTVTDVPNDQGRQVSIAWKASGYDLANSPNPVTEYAIYRQIDPALQAPPMENATELDGDWHYLLSVPACGDADYAVVVPTLADSTIESGAYSSTFLVRALTAEPAVNFESPPDSGWSVDNLAPNVPQGLTVDYAGSGNTLAWLESDAEDFRYFKIYRGFTPDFVVDTQNPLHMTTVPSWTDPAGDFGAYYKISAVDFAGNESPVAGTEGVTDAGGAPPVNFALMQNAPNPFNPRTTIVFTLPRAAEVTLRIFDLNGREVARLLDGAALDRGRHETSWDGRDSSGRRVAAGSYIYRLDAGGDVQTRRMMLVK